MNSADRTRNHRGAMAYHAGAAAEGRIAQDYERRGFSVAQHRWRGTSGEIDLIVRDGEALIFIEVKHSRSFERAAQRISAAQQRRIYRCAEEFLSGEPRGSLTEARFDVALVNGRGDTQIIENAFGHG